MKKHDSKLPSTSAERNEFKQLIQSGKRNIDEENFDEALTSVWKACTATKVPRQVEEIFKDSSCENITHEVCYECLNINLTALH